VVSCVLHAVYILSERGDQLFLHALTS
jgi:hypothetical protein